MKLQAIMAGSLLAISLSTTHIAHAQSTETASLYSLYGSVGAADVSSDAMHSLRQGAKFSIAAVKQAGEIIPRVRVL
jgi:hypothetical protein